MEKLKILIPTLGFGKSGGHRVLANLANNWIKNGHQVSFLSFYQSNLPYFPTTANIIWINEAGAPVNKADNNISKGILKKGILSLFRYLRINSKNFDIVLSNYNLTAFPIVFGSESNNFYYIQAYEPGFYKWSKNVKNNILKTLAWMTYYLPLKRIVNAEIYKNYKNIKSKYFVPPGLDLDIYYPKKLSPNYKEKFIVGCIGRKEEWKGSNDVGEAIKILHEKGIDIELKVAFNKVFYSNHELVQPNGDENLAKYYRSLDLLVAPGHIQLGAIHYPVIEAMACNVPVITTGYYPANEENSFLVPVKSPIILAETIEKAMKDYLTAIKKATVAENEIKQFDWEIVAAKFIEIFKAEIKL